MHNAGFLPPEVIAPIMQFPGQFVHGALSPDVFIGKGIAALEGHSHNWESGLHLCERSSAARWRAYSYGYLSHLAADTVAHNIFAPATLASAHGQAAQGRHQTQQGFWIAAGHAPGLHCSGKQRCLAAFHEPFRENVCPRRSAPPAGRHAPLQFAGCGQCAARPAQFAGTCTGSRGQ